MTPTRAREAGTEELLKDFAGQLGKATRRARLELDDEMDATVRTYGAFVWSQARSRHGQVAGVAIVGTGVGTAVANAVYGLPWRLAVLVGGAAAGVVASGVALWALIAYMIVDQRMRPAPLAWHRTAVTLVAELQRAGHWSGRDILYACDATLTSRKQTRTIATWLTSLVVTWCGITLGRDWLEKNVHPVAHAHASLAVVGVGLVGLVILRVYYAPIWPLAGVRRALRHLLLIGSDGGDDDGDEDAVEIPSVIRDGAD